MMKPLGIRNRILLAALAPAALVAILVSGILVAEHLGEAEAEQHRRLAAVARQLASAAEFSIFVGNLEGLNRLLETAVTEQDIVDAAFLDQRGEVLASTLPSQQLPRPDQVQLGIGPSPNAATLQHWHAIPIRPPNVSEPDLFSSETEREPPPLGQLLILVSNASLRDAMFKYIVKAAGISILMMVFGILLALGLSNSLIDLLLRIRKVVDQVGHGFGGMRVDRAGPDELGRLAEGINRMADRVEISQAELTAEVYRATRELRREKEEAEEAARSRSRFFAAASHDLRQPVQALGLFVARLEGDARRSTLLPRVKQLAHTVRNLQSLLDTLLDYSRLSGQVYRTDLRPVSAANAIALIHAEFAELAAEKGIELRRHTQDCWLMTDPALLHRILLNLVSNAIRATQQGGVLLACRRGATHARIQVWDTGPGIPADQQEAIFEELVQLDNPERDPDKGLGLGLAIVRRTAALLGHTLGLRSRIGEGTCFTLEIPLTAAPETAHEDEASGERVLVLGAESPERETLAELLEDWSHAATWAKNGDAAIAAIGQFGLPTLLICETAGDIRTALGELDRIDAAAGLPLPALLIHPGPLPNADTGSPARLLLSRPFRPARLRALIDHLSEVEIGEL
jgi:signal transduction histidine kinase/CheY-like chemotaxis protein